jgi:lambda family phage portal protein
MIDLLGKIENTLDRGLGVFFPKAEARRRIQRLALAEIRAEIRDKYERSGSYALYAAAKTTRLTGSWRPVNANVNDIITGSWDTTTARIRQLIRDFPYFKRATNIMVDYSVGGGILFRSAIRDANNKLNRVLNQKIDDAFHFWADEADFCKQLHFYEMMALAKRQDMETGNFLLVKTHSADKGRFLPFALRMYEPDWLMTSLDSIDYRGNGGKIRIQRGIEYNYDTGETLAYHFQDPDAWNSKSGIRIPKSDIIHGFETLRPGQRMGISPYVAGVLLAGDLQSIIESELDASKMASKWLAIVETDAMAASQIGRGTKVENGTRIESLENAIIDYLRPGEKITLSSNPRPGDNFAPFVKLILTMLSVTTGAPYELLSGNYEGMNFSTSNTVRKDFAHELKPICMRHIRQFCLPSSYGFYDAAVLNGKLDLPKYFTTPYAYLKMEWQPPGMESIVPLQETKAYIDQMSAGIRSPQEFVKARGRNLEDVLNEIAEAREMAEERDLDFNQKPGTAAANNPAALGASDTGKGGKEE